MGRLKLNFFVIESLLLSISQNPLEWWHKNGHLFPTIANVARHIFALLPLQTWMWTNVLNSRNH